ncbi:hypothetical protein [Chitinophaga nivalis]|uniref:Uncharacterized protein n=1 Tax=Chitinophaga nivalis TaxID=2991709 RepID=A0ABT3IWG0_9BACT|nr:hypothetical protein [Chitinophaga nivalis]MCW3462001.1 hypothetical protein [Chitinophaga nivalis]MCW3488308.1 hypothetical protein [Chitinophaga nivalis]
MKKLLLVIAFLFTVQLLTADAIPPVKNNTTIKYANTPSGIKTKPLATIAARCYLTSFLGIRTTTCLANVAIGDLDIINENGFIIANVPCPSSIANISVAVGDKIAQRLTLLSSIEVTSAIHTITQADINNGYVELDIL